MFLSSVETVLPSGKVMRAGGRESTVQRLGERGAKAEERRPFGRIFRAGDFSGLGIGHGKGAVAVKTFYSDARRVQFLAHHGFDGITMERGDRANFCCGHNSGGCRGMEFLDFLADFVHAFRFLMPHSHHAENAEPKIGERKHTGNN